MVKLTNASARDLQLGDEIKDHVVKGLSLRAGARSKSWLLYYRTATGERRRPKLGDFPALPIEAARDVARAWLLEIAKGNDPSTERQALRTAPRVSDLFEAYMQAQEAAGYKPRYLDGLKLYWRVYMRPLVGDLKVALVTPADIEDMRNKIAKGGLPKANGKVTVPSTINANRTLALASGMFALAETSKLNWRPRNSNPCAEVEDYPERKRKIRVPVAAFPRVFAELRRRLESDRVRVSALLVILYAGTRVTELITAPRSALSGGAITLEEHKTDRTGDDRTIRLPRQALALIEQLPRFDDGSIFGPVVNRWNVSALWREVRDVCEIPNIQLRDFRRTFATVAKSAGVSLDQIGELFDHKDTSTTQRYAWLFDEAATSTVQSVADEMDALANKEN